MLLPTFNANVNTDVAKKRKPTKIEELKEPEEAKPPLMMKLEKEIDDGKRPTARERKEVCQKMRNILKNLAEK